MAQTTARATEPAARPHRAAAAAAPAVHPAAPGRLVLQLQRQAGNASVVRLLAGRTAPGAGPTPTRPAPPRAPGLHRHDTSTAHGGPARPAAPDVQRDDLANAWPATGVPGLPGGGGAASRDQLRFTDRFFVDASLPTVCPNCHRERPTVPMPTRYVDREATEERLVAWAGESRPALQVAGTVRTMQLDPAAPDALVDDYGAGLVRRLTASHEFTGSTPSREAGAETVRRRWGDIRPGVRADLVGWYQNEVATAVGATPRFAAPVLAPDQLRRVLSTHVGGRAPLGRHGAEAAPGQTYGQFAIDDIGNGTVWFHLPGRPLWLYGISTTDFVRHDPFVAAVAAQVFDQTRWVLRAIPLLLRAGSFALGFSSRIAVVVLGIAMDELAQEMEAESAGGPRRSAAEILQDAGMQLVIDRVLNRLLGGAAGGASGATRHAAAIERIADRAAPIVRRELAEAEKPLVRAALEGGTARRVTDATLRSEGYLVEVAIDSAGQAHVFRLRGDGLWCRFSTRLCGLDLGADIARAAQEPASFTATRLAQTRETMRTAAEESDFLRRVYERVRPSGRMDLSVLTPGERAKLDQLAPTGAASDLSLRELRDLPRELGLGREIAAGATLEASLVRQLYREGRPIYEVMRLASPSYAASRAVRASASGRDAVTGLLPRSGALDVDHVVSLNEIVRMPGFTALRPERQLEVVNDVRNLRAVDASANRSRGDRSWLEWPGAAIHYPPDALARMRHLEDELRTYLTQRILALR